MNVSDFTILLAEDDANDILLIQRAFAKANLVNPLLIVRDGQEAIDYLARTGKFENKDRYRPPSLLLLDINLPKKSGLEVLEWIRAQGMKKFPIIVLSSSQQSSDVKSAYELGANAFVVKPVSFDGLLELVKSIQVYWMVLNKGPNDPDVRLLPPEPDG